MEIMSELLGKSLSMTLIIEFAYLFENRVEALAAILSMRCLC